jgi:hypothetical protein
MQTSGFSPRLVCGIYGGQSTGTGFSPVSIIPPMRHTYILFIYPQHYVLLVVDDVIK